jgi:tetratricopeptide (TPR) repeat protein
MLIVLFPAPLLRVLAGVGQRLKLASAPEGAPAIALPPLLPSASKLEPAEAEVLPSVKPDAAAEPPVPPVRPGKPRDTAGAIAALELARAYIVEVRDADVPQLDDGDTRRHHLNTLALASKKLAAAEQLDPDAVLEFEDDGDAYRYTISQLKADALFPEGLTHQVYDLKRAVPALVAAIKANPNHDSAYYVLGLTHAANYNKSAAIAAFERAVALDPANLKYRMELDRAQNLSAAEVAGYKTIRAGERIVDAGILSWNVFAFTWNTITFPLRVLVAILRFLRLAPLP